MTQIIGTTYYSGFRLHPGGPFPTSRSLEPRSAGPSVDASGGASTSSADFTRDAVQDALDHARIVEWAERVSTVGGPASLLVVRPDPDGFAPDYPSAVQAYREMSEVIDAL